MQILSLMFAAFAPGQHTMYQYPRSSGEQYRAILVLLFIILYQDASGRYSLELCQ